MGEGTRSGLWSEYARLIGELRPRYVIVENVSALLGRGLDRVLGDLAQIGYDAEWHCIPASAVGAPHRRDRIWIVAHPSSGRREGLSYRHTKSSDVSPSGDVANSNGLGYGWRRSETRRETRIVVKGGGDNGPMPMAHTHIAGLQIINETRDSRQTSSRIITGGKLERAYSESGAKQWRVEPNVGRVANGVPARVDRLKSLGNAVVPQIPELIGRAIVSAEAASPQED